MELVCPAGNLEKLHYAFAYGADAAYIGLKNFSLRIKADNFHNDEYIAIHALKKQYPQKRLFCAMNISFHNKDIDNFLAQTDYFKQYPFDAFIIQDVGMLPLIQKHFPHVAVHLSTQANCINREAAKLYHAMGFKRIVVGREASLCEISEIKNAVPELELETFVHGAMCIAYSGRCLMSSYMNGRSANAGFCSHSCRWDYSLKQDVKALAQSGNLVLEEKERPGEYFPVFEGDNFTAVLSSKDLCMIDYLNDFANAGVDSLKIEGRMKSLYYVALTTRAYRKAIDFQNGIITENEAKPFIEELYNSQHRTFGTGFYFGSDDANETTTGESRGEYELAATIQEALNDEQSLAVHALGESTLTLFEKELQSLHPEALKAKQADFELHPEKKPKLPPKKEHWHFYPLNVMNKITSRIPLEFVGPDMASIPLCGEDYFFVNPVDGTIMHQASHNHECFLYTCIKIYPEWIMRMKNA